MSVERCKHCQRYVDTDFVDAYEGGDEPVCESCRERLYSGCGECGETYLIEELEGEDNLCAGCRGASDSMREAGVEA